MGEKLLYISAVHGMWATFLLLILLEQEGEQNKEEICRACQGPTLEGRRWCAHQLSHDGSRPGPLNIDIVGRDQAVSAKRSQSGLQPSPAHLKSNHPNPTHPIWNQPSPNPPSLNQPRPAQGNLMQPEPPASDTDFASIASWQPRPLFRFVCKGKPRHAGSGRGGFYR